MAICAPGQHQHAVLGCCCASLHAVTCCHVIPPDAAQISKGFAVAMQSLMANQTARALSDKLLKAEKTKGAHMNSSLNSKDKLLHDLQAQVRNDITPVLTCCRTAALLVATSRYVAHIMRQYNQQQ